MFGPASPRGDLGAQNVAAARATLQANDISIVAADTGGTSGRTVWLEAATGAFTVRTRSEGTEA